MLGMEFKKTGTVLKSDQIKFLSPDQRENYVRNVLKDILSLNENGVTITEASKITGFNRITIAKHLEQLTSIREAYKKERGNASIYYKNGRLIHPTDKKDYIINDKMYSFFRLENSEGSFIYIQEKQLDINNIFKIKGGIIIPINYYQYFIDSLMSFSINDFKEGDKNEL